MLGHAFSLISDLDDISDLVTRMDIDSAEAAPLPAAKVLVFDTHLEKKDEHEQYEEDEERQADGGWNFCNSIFRATPEPVLPLPAGPRKKGGSASTGRLRRAAISTCSSVRLAARPSSIRVAERAERRLMRELDFINTPVPQPDAAVTAYVDQYGEGLPEDAIKAIRLAMRMGNKNLTKALEALVQEAEVTEMEA